MARPVFERREDAGVESPDADTVEAGRLGRTPRREEKMGRCSGSRRVRIAKVRVSSSTSWGGLLGFAGWLSSHLSTDCLVFFDCRT